MSKHTQGPWTIDEDGDVIAGDKLICVVTGADKDNDEERPANARLIAAAPKLLEALRPFAKFACSGPCDCMNCRARDAINKTIGETK